MKKLYKIKLEHEAYRVANSKQEALESWLNGVESGEGMDMFLDNLPQVEEIDVGAEEFEDGD